MKSLLKFIPKCPCCNKPMILDDVDYRFEGNQDEYWLCENYECNTSAIVEFRYGKICHRPVKYFGSDRELNDNDFIYPKNKL